MQPASSAHRSPLSWSSATRCHLLSSSSISTSTHSICFQSSHLSPCWAWCGSSWALWTNWSYYPCLATLSPSSLSWQGRTGMRSWATAASLPIAVYPFPLPLPSSSRTHWIERWSEAYTWCSPATRSPTVSSRLPFWRTSDNCFSILDTDRPVLWGSLTWASSRPCCSQRPRWRHVGGRTRNGWL